MEDDPKQLTAWQSILGCTAYEVESGRSFSTPEELEAYFADPEVGLFLLDIRIGSDLTAGIRVDELLLRRRIARQEELSDPSALMPLSIVLWSNSIQATKEAHSRTLPILEDKSLRHTINYSGQGSGRFSSRNVLSVKVCQKSFKSRW